MTTRRTNDTTLLPAKTSASSPADGRFKPGRTIGKGGQAVVHDVHDLKLDRHVAMKVLKLDERTRADEVNRFVDEARITAGLEHPHVPAVHELGVAADGSHWFTMKLVEGETLAALLAPNRFNASDDALLYRALQVLIKVCEAVSFAHSRGVIHCDLKPSNVMVGSHGQVYVMDWGISRRLSAARDTGEVLGTLGYMSPEQARGENDRLDPRTDVYALGALLYRVVVGFPPYHAISRAKGLMLAKKGAVFPPEEQAKGRPLSRRLLEIALKALSPDREKRHPSTDSFQADLESYVRGAARFPERVYRKGEVVVREGEPADCAFLIRSGSLVASRGGEKLRVMKVGELFGEAAILDEQRRTATVTARVESRLAVLSKASLAEEMGRADVLSLALTSVLRRFHDLEKKGTGRKRLGR